MRTEIKELHQRLKTTTVYVTHDQIEAMTMADKIVVMHDGIVEQIGAPLELYDRPRQPVRRRLHRLAGDELPEGHDQGRRPQLREAERRHRAAAGRRAGGARRPAGRLRHAARASRARRRRRSRPKSWWSSRPARRPRSSPVGGEEIVARVPRAPPFKPGEKIRLTPDAASRPSVRCGDRQAA